MDRLRIHTEEHVWPKWVSKLLKGQYGSDHFVHVRSASDSTTGLWKSPDLKVTTDQVCIRCNNEWLSALENDHVKPIATPLILDQGGDIIKPSDQWILAAWAYKMALLLESQCRNRSSASHRLPLNASSSAR